MSSQHHATPEQWQAIEANNHLPTRSCLLELHYRIEALEAAAQPAQLNHPAKPDSSLVERVAFAITGVTGDSDGPINWKPEARAAIREVAKWLRDHWGGRTAAIDLLERDAER